MSTDILVCPSCQTYNLPDASRCLQCGGNLAADVSPKSAPKPPPLSDPELDFGPFRSYSWEYRQATGPFLGKIPLLPRLLLGILTVFAGLVFLLLIAPLLAMVAVPFLIFRLFLVRKQFSRWNAAMGIPAPDLFRVVGGTLLALAAGAVACVVVVAAVIVAVFKEIFD